MLTQNAAQKKLKKLMLLALLVSSVLFSCSKFDASPTTLQHDANFVQKFFETKTAPHPIVAKVIEQLKAENERTGFVNKLPKNCGLPVWDKIVPQKQAANNNDEIPTTPASHGPSANTTWDDSTTNIIIPLTITNTNLSSVIVVEDIENTPTVECYTTNDYLYEQTHGANVNVTAAMNELTLFFYMENRTFGTTTFYHIPSTLFPAIHSADANGDKTISIADDTTTSGGFAPIVWVCNEYTGTAVNVCQECHQVSCQFTTYSTYQYTLCVPTGGGGGGGGGTGTGGTGGGGTGSGGSGGGPSGGGGGCPLIGGWYNNVAPPAGSGCDDPPPPPPPPVVSNPCPEVDRKSSDTAFKAKFQQLRADTGLNHESGQKVVTNAAGQNQYVPMVGTTNNPQIQFTFNPQEKLNSFMHNHYKSPRQLSVFSTGDLYIMSLAVHNTFHFNSSTFSMALTTQCGSSYLMLIEDSAKFASFADRYLSSDAKQYQLDVKYLLYGIKAGNSTTIANDEKNFLRLSSGLNMGLAVFRPNANFSGYLRIKLDANGNVITVACP